MGAAAWSADDIDCGFLFGCAGDLLGHIRRGLRAMAGESSRSEWRGGPFEWKLGGRRGPGQWGGGFGGWWPGPPGAPGQPRGPRPAAVTCAPRSWPCSARARSTATRSCPRSRSAPAAPGGPAPARSTRPSQALADEGLIAGEESAGRRTFGLTDAGREYVEQQPGHGPRRLGVGRAAGGLAGARPVHRGGPARRRHRADRARRHARPRSGRPSGCWSRPGGSCTGSWPTTTTRTTPTTTDQDARDI